MSREIKFRSAQYSRETDGFVKFTYWGMIDLENNSAADCFAGPTHISESYRKTDEQYTGLKDKVGVEVYEGDIMMSDKGVHFLVRWHEFKAGFYVRTKNVWSDGKSKFFHKSIEWAVKHSVCVGNVHENPELLK